MKKLILALLLIGVLYPQVSSQGSSDNIANTLVRRDASGDFDAGNIKGTTLESNSGTTINEFSIDGTLAGNSDDAIPTEKAVKAYADAIGAAGSDDQKIDVFSISGNNVQLSLESDGEATKTVDISTTTAVTANTAKVTNATHTGDVAGSGTLTIGADKVLESMLKVVNVAVDEDILTRETTTGDFEWHTPAELGLITTEVDPNVDTESKIEAITGALFGASKAVTAGYIWVADGVDFESVIMSGEATIASGGAITLDNDALDDQYYDSESDLTTLLDDNYEGELNNKAGLYAALSDVSLFLEDLIDDITPQLGGALDGQGEDLNNLGVIFMTEQAVAEVDIAGKLQLWTLTATPNQFWWTDDVGNDREGVYSGGDFHDGFSDFVANEHLDWTASVGSVHIGNYIENVSTSLSVGTVNTTTVAITSDGGSDDVVLPASTVSTAGMFTTAKWAEVVVNNAKNTNVSTALALAAPTATTVPINSDGSSPDITLIEATTTNAGLLGADKWDEIVASTTHKSSSGTDHSLLGATPGTASASKALIVDASKDIDLGTGDISATDGTFSGDADVVGNLTAGTIVGDGIIRATTSVFIIEQASDLGSIAGQGQFWVKDDTPNIPMFTDDTDVEWKIQVGTSGYGEMYFNANGNATVIETATTPIALRQFTTGSLSNFTYTVGTTGAVTAYYDRGANVGVHDDTHGLSTGDVISIRGTTNYNGIFSVTVVDADSFYIADTWNVDDGASDWDQGDYLTVTNTGTYKLDWDISAAESGGAGSTLTYAIYINTTIENKSRIQRKFANNDVGAFGGHAILSLSAGDIIFLTASSSGTNNMTHSYGALALEGI